MTPKTFLPPESGLCAVEAHGGTVTFGTAADGVVLRTAHFPAPEACKEAPPFLFLNGRTDFIEKNLETVDALHRRGHAVWTLDWRGQGRSGRMLDDPVKGHVSTFDLFLDDLDHIVETVVRPALGGRRMILLAHSMGGNIGMRFLHRRPELFERAVFTAPMISFIVPRVPNRVAHLLARAACGLPARAGRYAPGNGPDDPAARLFDDNRLTTCQDRFERTRSWLRHDRNLHLGGITWGWLRAALDSACVVGRTGFAESIGVPVLVLIAGNETIVDNAAIRHFVGRLPRGRLASIDDARHELLLEADGPRERVWETIDGFLAQMQGSDPPETAEMKGVA